MTNRSLERERERERERNFWERKRIEFGSVGSES